MKAKTSSSTPLLVRCIFVPICGLISAFVYSLTRIPDILDDGFSLLDAIPIALVGGVFIGGPIMLWIAIRERTITIIENYDDHKSFLKYLTAMLI